MSMVEDILQLFETYARAFASGDAESIVDIWGFPCQVSGAGKTRIFHTPAQFLNNMNTLVAFYMNLGVQINETDVTEVRRLSESAALVRVHDRYTLADTMQSGAWEYVFVVRFINQQWKIISAIMDDEAKFLAANGFDE